MNKLWSKNYISFCTNNFFQFMTHFFLMTTLPIFVVDQLHGTKEEVGLVIGIYLLGALISRPIMGKIIDEHDKKKVMLGTVLLFLISFLFYFLADNVLVLTFIRLLHGIAFGALNTATFASVASIIPPARMGEGIGYFAMAMTLGMIIGPMFALYLIKFDFIWLFAACVIFAFFCFFSTIILHLPHTKQAKPVIHKKLHWSNFIETNAMRIGIVGGFTSFAFSSISTFITLYAQHLSLLDFAPYFFLSSAIAVFISRPFIGKAFDRYGPNLILYPAFLLFSLGLITLSQITTGFGLILSGIIIGLGNGTLFCSLQSLAINVAPANKKGIATSTFFICFDFCASIGSFSLGVITAAIGYADTYLYCSAIVFIGAIAYYLLYHRNEKNILQKP